MSGQYVTLKLLRAEADALACQLDSPDWNYRPMKRATTIRVLARLRAALGGKDLRVHNRFPRAKGKPTLALHLRRKPA